MANCPKVNQTKQNKESKFQYSLSNDWQIFSVCHGFRYTTANYCFSSVLNICHFNINVTEAGGMICLLCLEHLPILMFYICRLSYCTYIFDLKMTYILIKHT